MKLLIFVTLALLLSSCSSDDKPALLGELDSVLAQKKVYESYFSDRVNVLKDILEDQTDPQQCYNINYRIADCYRVHDLDSAVFYLKKCGELARQIDDFKLQVKADMRLADIYVKAGYSIESSMILNNYRGRRLPDDVLADYYSAEHNYWGEVVAYSVPDQTDEQRWNMRDKFRELLLSVVEEDTWMWHNLKREEVDEYGDYLATRKHALAMIQKSDVNSREYAEACYYYAHTFEVLEPKSFHEWLWRSAIADVMCATKDYASLNEISRILFDMGDIDRAFRYVADHCMTDALYFNGKLRPWQVSQFFPMVERAYQQKSAKQTKTQVILLTCVSILSILLLFLLLFLYRRQQILDSIREKLQKSYIEIDNRNHELVSINSRLVALNAKMQEADKVKQEYITLFLGIVSDNISTTRQYKNKVLKSIRQGNTKAITDEIERLPSIDNDILDFYKMFDQTFVNLYPDFVEKFNALLTDGAAIVPKGDDILTPELRIFALIKLGISDSSRIASLLHYSANTIYNYRAKTKNKARGSRDNFEEAVRNID